MADERHKDDMKQAARKWMALEYLTREENLKKLADHQQRQVKEQLEQVRRFGITQAIAQSYRHLFYPSAAGTIIGAHLGHTVMEIANVSDSPGQGQTYIRRALREQKKLSETGDAPDAPNFVRDSTPLKTKGSMSTQELRNEFRRAPRLSILIGDDPFKTCIRDGVKAGTFIYRKGAGEKAFVVGKGDPDFTPEISEDAFVHLTADAEKHGLWPRQPKPAAGAGGSTQPSAKQGGDDRRSSGGSTAGPTGGGAGGTTAGGAATRTFSAEGPLRQALTELFEKARKTKVAGFSEMTVRLFEAKAAWNLHAGLATLRDAEAVCKFEVTADGEGGDSLAVTFAGAFLKSNPVKQFLDGQIKIALNHSFTGDYILRFSKPLATDEASLEVFSKTLTKFGGGEAFVEARADTTKA